MTPTLTTYRLTCGHAASVPGPHGATTGRAWCDACGESVPVAHTLARGPATAEDGYGASSGTVDTHAARE